MKKPFKVAAWSFIILLVLGFLLGIFINIMPLAGLSIVVYGILSPILGILVFYGFIMTGKRFKSKFLVIMSWIGIILLILYTLYFLFGSYFIDIPIPSEDYLGNISNQSQDDLENLDLEPLYGFLVLVLIAHTVISIILGIHDILFGIAQLKIRKKIKYAKTAGILNIISGATLFIFIGYIVIIVAAIFEILLLFEASRRFEVKRKK